MDAAYAAERIAAFVEQQGEAVTLVRGVATITTHGVRIAAPREAEMSGASAEQTFDVKIAAKPLTDAAWPAPPLRDDRLTIGGRTFVVASVDTRSIGGVAQHHVLTVAGSL